MSLDFLSAHPVVATPPRSPMLEPALGEGAVSVVRDGWETIESFGDHDAEAAACRETVGFADRSELGKLELLYARGTASELALGTAVPMIDGWRCPVRPDREIVICQAAKTASMLARMAGAARVFDLTGSFSALTVAGPLARDAFAQFCALDLRDGTLPVGGFRPGSIARTPGFVLRDGPTSFLVLTGAAYAEYVWGTVAAAATSLGGRPVGTAALSDLGREPTVA